jgi:transposase
MAPAGIPPSTEDLLAVIAAQQAQIAALLARIAELERRLGLNSSNSGKPPSSDGLQKPNRTRSLRARLGNKPGGQKGHPGETLRQSATPDDIVGHYPASCSGCGAALTPAMSRSHAARQVFDLPEPQPLRITEHRAHACTCTACGTRTRAEFPTGVNAPVQYGSRISAFAVYLLHAQFLPEDRLTALMADLFGVRLTAATIARMSRSCALSLHGFGEALRDLVAGARVKHMDETGFRIGGKTQWLHVASNAWLTFYRVSAKRGSLMQGVCGIVVHDHWKPYYTMPDVQHALCNAHHLRELQALVEIEKEEWSKKMQRLLRRACHVANLARERGMDVKPQTIARIERCYRRILSEGFAFHLAQPAHGRAGGAKRGRVARRTGHNLLIRLADRSKDTLRFLHDLTVAFTNNQAERDIRMMKIHQKISGGFRSWDSAADFALIRSFLSTARKQGWKIIEVLTQCPDRLAQNLRVA